MLPSVCRVSETSVAPCPLVDCPPFTLKLIEPPSARLNASVVYVSFALFVVETVCPWGNRINLHAPDEGRFGRIVLGIPYIRFDVRPGTAAEPFAVSDFPVLAVIDPEGMVRYVQTGLSPDSEPTLLALLRP